VTNEVAHIAARVKEAARSIAPDAEVILYGSRARGDFSPDSDWDFLILTDDGDNWNTVMAIHDAVYDVELAEDEVISCAVDSRDAWNSELKRATPFHRNVTHDGIAI